MHRQLQNHLHRKVVLLSYPLCNHSFTVPYRSGLTAQPPILLSLLFHHGRDLLCASPQSDLFQLSPGGHVRRCSAQIYARSRPLRNYLLAVRKHPGRGSSDADPRFYSSCSASFGALLIPFWAHVMSIRSREIYPIVAFIPRLYRTPANGVALIQHFHLLAKSMSNNSANTTTLLVRRQLTTLAAMRHVRRQISASAGHEVRCAAVFVVCKGHCQTVAGLLLSVIIKRRCRMVHLFHQMCHVLWRPFLWLLKTTCRVQLISSSWPT